MLLVEILIRVCLATFRVAIDEPVGRAVNAIGIRLFFVRTLQFAPHELLEVILQAFDFRAAWKADVLGSDERRFAEPGVVAGQHVYHPVCEDVGIVDRTHDSRLHIVRGVDTVPPFARVAHLLMFDNKRRPLLDERLERLGYEVFKVRAAATVMTDRQHVFTQPLERHFIHVMSWQGFTERRDGGLVRKLRINTFD